MAESESPGVVDLVGAGVPADQGLSGLGLLMQLAGHVLAALGVVAFATLVVLQGAHGSVMFWLFAIFASSCLRSMLQIAAGKQLVYGGAAARFGGVRRYAMFAIAQSVAIGAILGVAFSEPSVGISVALGLLVWPVTLLVASRLPRFARFDAELPVSEDKGFEGAAIYMLLFGTTAVLATGLVVWGIARAGTELQHGTNIFVLLAGIVLLIRSILHTVAGAHGLRATSVDASTEAVNRYATFGVISAFCGGGAFLISLMGSGAEVVGMAFVCGLVWLLLAWPLIVRRFFADRQFADLLAGGDAPIHRRAPDAGLTWLGWGLVGLAAWSLSFVAPDIVASSPDRAARTALVFAGGDIDHSLWWSVGRALLEGWAGFELVRMSPQSKLVATAYGVVAIAIALYFDGPAIAAMGRLPAMSMASTPDFVFTFVTMAISLVVPVTTIALVHRKIAPGARARFRSPA